MKNNSREIFYILGIIAFTVYIVKQFPDFFIFLGSAALTIVSIYYTWKIIGFFRFTRAIRNVTISLTGYAALSFCASATLAVFSMLFTYFLKPLQMESAALAIFWAAGIMFFLGRLQDYQFKAEFKRHYLDTDSNQNNVHALPEEKGA